MPHYTYRNINAAFYGLITGVCNRTLPVTRQSSRNGSVLRIKGPVIITYLKPEERVLFNQVRDCNPFFHLYESLWMLAGHNDVASLEKYTAQMRQFSDDGIKFNGAYGYRWMHAGARYSEFKGAPQTDRHSGPGINQIKLLAAHLKRVPDSRRAVLQMWTVEDDLLKIDPLLSGENFSKDVCCNLSAVFEIDTTTSTPALNMSVFNRSNDMILGMFGANVVHFSILHEFMAKWIGVKVGVYNQITTNLHIYESNWKEMEYFSTQHETMRNQPPDYADIVPEKLVPLVSDPILFDQECRMFVLDEESEVKEPFLREVAQPMCRAFKFHKERDYRRAYEQVTLVKAADWRWVGQQWLEKREANYKQRNVIHRGASRD